ncbi:MAG: flavin reductase family protein [Synechococcaceae cyanobacterium ELA445]
MPTIDPSGQSKSDTYRLITNLVVPRPIAWITSQSDAGVVNLAPFSYFNVFGSDPPYVAVGIGRRDNGEPKDTARNIEETGAFVIHLVTEELIGAMNLSAADFPPDQSELEAAGLALAPGERIQVPRLTAAPASLECRLHQVVPLGANQLFIAEVVLFHLADQLFDDRGPFGGFAPIGRLGSPSVYCRTIDRFELPRISHEQWLTQA